MRKLFAKAQDPISCETHALGAVAALGGGLLYLLRGVWTDAAIPAVAAALCFCLSMAALYAASAIYHYYPGTAASGGVKRVLRKMDHSMIYVLIAGSYTPFCVVLLPQPKGTRFCLILWGVALAGVLAKMLWINAPRMLSTAVYLIMGWSVVFVAKDFTALGQPCLTLVSNIREKLLALREQQKENRRVCGNCYSKKYDGYVFVDAMGNIFNPRSVTANFSKLLEQNGLRHIRFHDLRHSCASLLLANDVPLKQIQEWLGHSDIGTTANIYSHLDYKSKITSANVMDNILTLPDTRQTGWHT